MSQQQPQSQPPRPRPRPEDPHRPAVMSQDQPISYGDVFPITGASTGVATVPNDPGAAQSMAIVDETDAPGFRAVTKTLPGQVVARYKVPVPTPTSEDSPVDVGDSFTIGEALEACGSASGRPVDRKDAAAIQAAEMRATRSSETGEVGKAAQAMAAANERAEREIDKIKLSDVLKDASTKMVADKAATREDAAKVAQAEARNEPGKKGTRPGGVADSVKAAAGLN